GQVFVNGSSAGDTYLLRSGAKIVDDSRLYVGQLQHSYMPSDRQRFTYGVDALLTRPSSDRTINGRNEDNDDINEYGVYVQSETKLSDQWTFLAAGRFDDHNLLDNPVFSPRAALKFQPDANNTFRATFNQAYSTPSTLNFYLDVLSASVPTSAINPALIPVIGPTILNARGTGSKDGFTYNFGPDGRPWMVSLYGGALYAGGAIPTPNTYLSPDVANVWPAMRALLVAQDPSLDPVLPQLLSGPAPGQFLSLNTVTGSFDPFDYNNVVNLDPIEETKTTTYELGYKGVLGKKLAVSVNGYYSEIKDFIGPLRVETPHVFINGATFVPQLTADIIATGVVTDPAQAQAIA
ncbi:MAG TPA: TonB-dependent receptor, partial [candidate division Zixibacteria bacterium]|nr:TonB-dependent receptor [candidate division Zixibacteria bacterium]